MLKPSLVLIMLPAAFTVMIIGCSVSHQTMRGSVVMKIDQEAHICIGSDDGIKVGDVVTIYRAKALPLTKEAIVPDQKGRYIARTRYEKVKAGRAKVTAILSEHYAAIEMIEGQLEMSDIVEVAKR